jgi:hypothetical protein
VTFDATPHIEMLKAFQRRTVDHVVQRIFDDSPAARRFLVADETGLGKSMVARGVIAHTIERLQHDPSVDRIDIVYVCSNADIARQNLERLDILGTGSQQHSTRLTLLARDSGDLDGDPHPDVGKRVNLISFTPNTSFDVRTGGGRSDERALLFRILDEELDLDGYGRRTLAALLQGGVTKLSTFQSIIENLDIELDPAIVGPFLRAIRTSGLRRRVMKDLDALGRRTNLSETERKESIALVGALRAVLAKAGVDALQPDLVILDEFQRFRHLLDPTLGDSAELAHALFDFGDARVLLLSATPYKPFTYAEEASAGDNHEADLRKILEFLSNSDKAAVDTIVANLAQFRRYAVEGGDVEQVRSELEHQLTQLMCRTERPRLGEDGMLLENVNTVDQVSAEDVADFVAIRRLSLAVGAQMNVDYWKSTPYFVNFSDGYQLGSHLKECLKDPAQRGELRPLLRLAQRIEQDQVQQLSAIDPGNARMRQLTHDTVGAGWWRLLWMPPSIPYQSPGGPFADSEPISKRLVFSSWAATPTAIASLLSHDATRRMAGGPDRLGSVGRRLDWRLTPEGRPGAMTTLMLFWPVPALALAADPRVATSALGSGSGNEANYWRTVFSDPMSIPAGFETTEIIDALSGRADSEDRADGIESARLRQHTELAVSVASARRSAPNERWQIPDADPTLQAIATYGPANIAYRCVERIAGPDVSVQARWRAAAIVASGVRTLFNRPETILLLSQLLPDVVYWRAVLTYCAWGNLEATLDEHLHHLCSTYLDNGMTDQQLLAAADRVYTSLTLRPARYEAFDPFHPTKPIPFMSRFALRYGSKRATTDENSRQPDVQAAFNSPFWPFVLATTSIGQEGIDFHWWCHSTCHWNTPASPVDFEQREGRVSRYGGLAVRRNLAYLHGDGLVSSLTNDANPWVQAFELGASSLDDRFEELAPHWICNGPTKVERHLFPYPLSRDLDRYLQLKDDLVLYRLTFGQPRQEDLLELLRRRGVAGDPERVAGLSLDLRPPLR